ncbi:MAG: NAD(P)H-hydrate dehydratase [Flavobacterium sp.]|nr:MAG: NAD(P)H-hydrate dehydratase [Flavobacterium sp.]
MKITKESIQNRLRATDPKSHKGTLGHALIIGGSHGKIGAVCLSSKAALKTGCGLVTAFLPECGYEIIQSYVPEVMAITDISRKNISRIEFEIKPSAIGIGPGMGQEPMTQNALREFLKDNTLPLVIDADALNILSQNKSWLKLVSKGLVLTPHPKEFERLVGTSESDHQRIEMAKSFSKQFDCILVLKGAPTVIIYHDDLYENTTGNAALATAGSGDVLTGIITSLIAQAYKPLEAAIVGVYLHGLTADIALPETGTQSFIASDIINYIGKAYLSLQH